MQNVSCCYTSLPLILLSYRSSRPEVFCRKVFLEISQNSQENTCARVWKKRLAQVFPVNFAKFLGTSFLTEHLQWLLLILGAPPVAAPVLKIRT